MTNTQLHIIVFLLLAFSCTQNTKSDTLFQRLKPQETGITFENQLIENDTFNILNFANLYTGSGVGIADFDKDGLPDIFLGGNMEACRVYKNFGGMKFEERSRNSLQLYDGVWITGIAIVDINQDGWQDVYCCVSGIGSGAERRNLFFENAGENTPAGIPKGFVFEEKAREYGISDTAQCTHANFFDYDKDGDLDLFLLVNPTNYTLFNVNNIRKRKLNGEAESTDKLYRNDGRDTKGQVLFSDVSAEAGILVEGYGLGVYTGDINGDYWPDIYVSNDFLTMDVAYINNQDGTFSDKIEALFKHTSFAGMGVDIADINNDARPDIVQLDMLPEDDYRAKMIASGAGHNRYFMIQRAGYQPQYSRNMLQLNSGENRFSEIGQMAAMHRTDWSWSVLLADFDLDGFRDMHITNGFRRDLGDLDYIMFNNEAFGSPESRRKKQLNSIQKQPGAKLLNYFFRNKNGLQMERISEAWGIVDSSYSHGAAYTDLDLDGDLDLVVNNVCQPVFIFENQANTQNNNHYIKLKFENKTPNKDAIGAQVWAYAKGNVWYAENNPYRGYESTVEAGVHLGVGQHEQVDSVRIIWPDLTEQWLYDLSSDSSYFIQKEMSKEYLQKAMSAPLFEENSELLGLQFRHKEDLKIDFDVQPLLPHQHSLQGPCLAKGDVNGDGLEDVFVGAAKNAVGQLFCQKEDGTFEVRHWDFDKEKEDCAALFFDVDGDSDLDLYVASGGVLSTKDKSLYQDRMYINDGAGNFSKQEQMLPTMPTSTSTVAAHDFDDDGDLDLFVGGRVEPMHYPQIPHSYFLENQNGKFIDVTSAIASDLAHIGMVTDAVWVDMTGDAQVELVLVGEFMPISVFELNDGKLEAISLIFQEKNTHKPIQTNGWWNCVEALDADGDGDLDLLLGNLGLNSDLKASQSEPVSLHINDYDNNGRTEAILCHYLNGKEVPTMGRDVLLNRMPKLKNRFSTYASYAKAGFDGLFSKKEKADMVTLSAYLFESCFAENLGNGRFEIRPFPLDLQMAPIQDFAIADMDGKGGVEAIAVGNSYATEVGIGQYDAFGGALLRFDERIRQFEVLPTNGFWVQEDARAVKVIQLKNKKAVVVVGVNNGNMRVFE